MALECIPRSSVQELRKSQLIEHGFDVQRELDNQVIAGSVLRYFSVSEARYLINPEFDLPNSGPRIVKSKVYHLTASAIADYPNGITQRQLSIAVLGYYNNSGIRRALAILEEEGLIERQRTVEGIWIIRPVQ